MSLSFEESLKNNSKNNIATTETMVATTDIDDMGVALPSVMTLEENFAIAAYSGDDGNWQQHPDYVYYHVFSDSNISNIDDEKNITLNRKQFNITQEENSQYIPFEMSRYYDGFDLVNATISIHYETNNKRHGATKPINVTFNDEKIRFGWLVDAGATIDVGKLKFEIHAYGSVTGNDGIPKGYVWKTKTNENLNVLQSLCDCEDVINNIDDSWIQELVTDIAEKVADEIKNVSIGEQVKAAEDAADRAEQSANDAANAATNAVNAVIKDYATLDYVDRAIDSIDVTDQLASYVKTSHLEANYYTRTDTEQRVSSILADYATKDDVANAIDSAELDNYYKKDETYSKSEIDEKVSNVTVDLTGYATEAYVDNKTGILSSDVGTNKENIASISTALGELQEEVGALDKSPRLTYDVVYNDEEDEKQKSHCSPHSN